MRFMSVAALAVAALGQTAFGQEGPLRMTMQLFNVQVAYAPPPWVAAQDQLDNTELHRQQGTNAAGQNAFIMEFIPKGESFESWSALYAIQATENFDGSAADSRDGTLGVYHNACEDFGWQPVAETPGHTQVFAVFCGSYKDKPAMGEVAVFNYQVHRGTLVQNYFHKRLPAFTLPMTPDVEEQAWRFLLPGTARVSVFRDMGEPAQ